MSAELDHNFGDSNAVRPQCPSLFPHSEREVFRAGAALVPGLVDADDIVQQAAPALGETFDQYDPARPFPPWACRFAPNKARRWNERRQRWQALRDTGLAEELAQRCEGLRPEFEMRLAHREGCLAKLPEEHRSPVGNCYLRRNDIGHLAENVGRNAAAVCRILHGMRRALHACIMNATRPDEVAP